MTSQAVGSYHRCMTTPDLSERTLVLGVTGGIAAYKAVDLLRRLRERGARVRVTMTRAATAFVGPLTFEALSGQPVLIDVLALDSVPGADRARIGHVALAAEADAVIVAPATADFLARAASGRADDPLGAILLSTRAPLLIAPAMEHHMWWHDATQANLRTLIERGASVVGPAEGALASGAVGSGRLAEVADIVAALDTLLGRRQDLLGRRLLISAGPTREPVDPVRYLGNRSSGRMGFALADEARRRGAEVVLVHGPSSRPLPATARTVAVETAAEMHREVLAAAPGVDAVIMAAAVADYTPATTADHKLSKGEHPLERIELVRTADILAELCQTRAAPVIVGFAAETQDHVERGKAKRARKGADLLLANLVGVADSGFDVATSQAALIHADDRVEDLGQVSKLEIARRLLDAVAAKLELSD